MYSSTASLTPALVAGGCSTPRSGRFTPGKDSVPIVQETGWVIRPVWRGVENLAPPHRDSIPAPFGPYRVALSTELTLCILSDKYDVYRIVTEIGFVERNPS